MKLHKKNIPAPQKVREQLAWNHQAFEMATKDLPVRPFWSVNEIWAEPKFANWVEGLVAQAMKDGKKSYTVAVGRDYSIDVSWLEE